MILLSNLRAVDLPAHPVVGPRFIFGRASVWQAASKP
jgi:hypothetical protein